MAVPFEYTLRSLDADRRRAGWMLFTGASVLLSVWIVVATTVPIPVTVSSVDGRVVSALQPVEITSPSTEPIVTVHVRLGDRVAQGDALVELDSGALSLELASGRERARALAEEIETVGREAASLAAESRAEQREHERTIDQLEAHLGERRAELEHAVTAERLYGELRSERRIDALKYSEARAALERARRGVEAAEAELRREQAAKDLALSRGETLKAQLGREEARLRGALAALDPELRALERRIGELTLRAPFAGEIGGVAGLVPGRSIEPGAWMLTLVPDRELEFRAWFPAAAAAGRLRPTQDARVEFFALPWTEYGLLAGTVARVGSEERDGLVRVDLAMDDRVPLAGRLSHGLKGRATVELESTTIGRKLVNLLGAWHVAPIGVAPD